MSTPLRALQVEDSEADAELVIEALRTGGFDPTFTRVQTAETMHQALTTEKWDIILSDFQMPGFDAMAALRVLQKSGLNLPFIIISGTIGEETAVAAMKLGATDYLLKDRLTRLGQAVRQALEQGRLRAVALSTNSALQRSQANLAMAQRIAGLGSWELDLANANDVNVNPLRWSDELFRIFGYEPGTVTVTKDFFFQHVHPDDREKIRAAMAETLRTACTYSIDHRIILPDGTERIVHEQADLMRDAPNGRPLRMVGTAQDITERMKLEEQFRQSQKMEAIGQLSGGVAHDFNNLLTVIKGHIGLLRAKDQVPPEIADSIQQIDEAADRAANLTRQLLTFSRQQVMQPVELNLNGVVSNLTKMLRRLLSESIEMEVECAPQPLPIRADEGMVEQVLLNLVVNARDAMVQGGTLRVTTELVDLDEAGARMMMHGRAGPFVCLTVTDTGSGIAPEVLPRIFEPFFTTKGVGKGTGLGLATVYAVMQQHDGWINVESVVNHGTIFRAYFPRLATAVPESLTGPDSLPVQGGHEGILLVEDESAVREVAEAALSSLGYRVFSAPSGLAALQVWEAHRHEIALLLTDLVMPDGITGRDLALRLRGTAPRLSVIYMSGYSPEVAGSDFPLQEGTNYLPKPFDLSSLAQLVRASLDRGSTSPPSGRRPG